MMTSPNGNIFRVTGHLCGEFTGLRWIPRTKTSDAELFDVFFDMFPNNRLSKQSWGWWFETPSGSLWRHSDEVYFFQIYVVLVHCDDELNAQVTYRQEVSLKLKIASNDIDMNDLKLDMYKKRQCTDFHDDAMTWKRFPHIWSFPPPPPNPLSDQWFPHINGQWC